MDPDRRGRPALEVKEGLSIDQYVRVFGGKASTDTGFMFTDL